MKRIAAVLLLSVLPAALLPIACGKKNNTSGPSPAPTATSTPTPTPASPTVTFTVTSSPTVTNSPTETTTPSPSPTSTQTVWPTPQLIATFGPGTYGSVRGMACTSTRLYVANGVGNVVNKYDLQGTPVAWTPPSVPSAWGLALDSSENIYVTSSSDIYLRKFNASATPVATWSVGTRSGALTSDASDNIYVASDLSGKMVQKFSDAGVSITSWTTSDTWSFGIHALGTTLYVGNVNNHTVDLYGLNGTSLGSWPSGINNLAIASSPAGNIYVAGDASVPVKLFSPSGTLLVSWGSFLSTGLCVTPSGDIFVGSYNAGVIYKYRP